jgi:transposase
VWSDYGGNGVDGVYWIPLVQILEARGFEVFLVNAQFIKNVTGKKTDILDCQWIQQLHTYGLLKPPFARRANLCPALDSATP